MRGNIRAWLVSGIVIWLCTALFAGGGPDLFGYRWLDSNDTTPGAPVFNWVDIPSRPDAVRLYLPRDDDLSVSIPMEFNFHFYWTNFSNLKIHTNGHVTFNNFSGLALCLDNIATPGGQADNFIAPFLGDLTFADNYAPTFVNPGEIWYWTNRNDSMVVSWINAPFWRRPGAGVPTDFWGSNTFQLILTAADSGITFQYQHTNPATWATDSICVNNMLIGIENLTGNIGLAAYSDEIPPDTTDYAIKYLYPAVPGVVTPDPAPVWNENPDNQAQFIMPGLSTELITQISNLGNQNLTSNTRIFGRVTPLDPLNVLWADTLDLPSIGVGSDTIMTFPDSLTLASYGQYYYKVRIINPDDLNLSNNENSVELSVVEETANGYRMTYCTLNPPDGAIGWGLGPDYGVGLYMEPPDYPAEIYGVDLFILDFRNDTTIPVGSGYRINVYAEDSIGRPGALLHSHSVAKDSVISDDWNYIDFDSLVSIDSGGFYIAWLHDGDSISLGTEEFGPISRRTYEIIAGGWAPYRDGNTEDFLFAVNALLPVGIKKPAPEKLEAVLFPNPANDHIRVKLQLEQRAPVTFRLMDVTGNPVLDYTHPGISAGEHLWSTDISHLPDGIYLMQISAQQQQTTLKLVVLH